MHHLRSLVVLLAAAGPSGAGASCTSSALESLLRTEGRIPFREIDVLVGFDHVPDLFMVEFTILAPTDGWVGFGVSELGSMKGSDMVIVEPSDDGFLVTDRFAAEFHEPTVDKLQNWEMISAEHLQVGEDCPDGPVTVTKAVVRRLMDTCDVEDYKLTPDFMKNYFVAAYGRSGQRNLGYHGHLRQSTQYYLHIPRPMVPKEATGPQMDVWSPTFQVPSGKTNYCYSKVRITSTAYITAFAVLDTHKVHHLSLHKAAHDSASWTGDSVCDTGTGVMGIPHIYWALGAAEQLLPYGLFMKVDPGEYFFEAHFENADGRAFTSNTGFRLWVHDNSSMNSLEPENEIQPIKIDSRWTSQIPAGEPLVEASYELPTECLEGLPSEGVSVLVTVAHMHEAGKSLKVFRTRGDRTDKVFEHLYYDFNRQGPIWKKWHLLPGDLISWTCNWNTTGFSKPRTFGIATSDEMCQIVIFTNVGMPFRVSISNIEANGGTYAYCGNAKVGTPCTANCDSIIASPPSGSKVLQMRAHPAPEHLVERGQRREVCSAMGVAEAAGPPNNWTHVSLFAYLAGLWAAYSLLHMTIGGSLRRRGVEKERTWVIKRSVNILEGIVGIVVGLLIYTRPEYFAAEVGTVYDMANGAPIGFRYYALNTAADLTGAFYMTVLMLKAGNGLPVKGDFLHHGSSILVIAVLHQAFEYEFAPQLCAVFSAWMLTHVVAAVPVLFAFAAFKLSIHPGLKRRLAKAVMVSAYLKMGIQLLAHAFSVINYVAIFEEGTFYARSVSASEWSKRAYRAEWPSFRDTLAVTDWESVLVLLLPPVWLALFVAQVYNMRFQIMIARAGTSGVEHSIEKLPVKAARFDGCSPTVHESSMGA